LVKQSLAKKVVLVR